MIEIRDYQQDIIKDTISYFNTNDKAIINMCCGSGKTFTSLLIAKNMNINKLLILVPSLILLEQWKNNIKIIFINHYIQEYNNNIDNNNYQIVLSTYHNSLKIYNKNLNFDLVIYDECHHLTGDITKLSNKNNQFLHALNINTKKQLSLTATMKKIKLNSNIIDNFNIDYFGDCIVNHNIQWGIINNIITDFNIQLLLVNQESINNIIIEDIKNNTLYLSAFIALKNIEQNISNHILIYANTIKSSQLIIKYITDLINSNLFDFSDPIVYFDYTSQSNKLDNSSKLENIEYCKYSIITSVYSLGEGFDLPILDTVIFSENMVSEIRIIQAALRPCRKYLNKKNALIILPIINNNGIAYSSDFKKIKIFINSIEHNNNDKDFIKSKINIYDYKINKKNKIYNTLDIIKYNHNNTVTILNNIILSKNDFKIWDDKNIKINNYLDHNFTFSKLLKITLNNLEFVDIPYHKAKRELYNLIDNAELIINNTTLSKGVLNYGRHKDKKVEYYEKYNIFTRGIDANTCIKEIIILSNRLNINIYLEIKFKNNEIIIYSNN